MYTLPLAQWAIFIFAMIQSIYGYQAYEKQTDSNFDMTFGLWSGLALFCAGIGVFINEYYGVTAAILITAVGLAFYARRFVKTWQFRTVGVCTLLSIFFLWVFATAWQTF